MIESKFFQNETSLSALGLLVGDSYTLKYCTEDTTITIRRFTEPIWSLLATQDEIYCGLRGGLILGLFGNLIEGRDDGIESIIEHNGHILDSGGYGVYIVNIKYANYILFNSGLDVSSVTSIFSHNGSLYGLVKFKDNTNAIVIFEKSNDPFSFGTIGDTLLRYGPNVYSAQAIPVPGELKSESGKTYPFSVISCANLRYLDLNGEEIAGTKVRGQINTIALLSSTPKTVNVVYSGYGLNAIKQAEINLEEKTAETFTFVDGLSDSVSAIAPVYDKKLHERLLVGGRR